MFKIGNLYRASRNIPLSSNQHIKVLSSAAPSFIPKGSEAEMIAINNDSFTLNVKEGGSWGLKIEVKKFHFGLSFE